MYNEIIAEVETGEEIQARKEVEPEQKSTPFLPSSSGDLLYRDSYLGINPIINILSGSCSS